MQTIKCKFEEPIRLAMDAERSMALCDISHLIYGKPKVSGSNSAQDYDISSSTNLSRYGLYVLFGLVLGQGEPVL